MTEKLMRTMTKELIKLRVGQIEDEYFQEQFPDSAMSRLNTTSFIKDKEGLFITLEYKDYMELLSYLSILLDENPT